MIQHFKNKYIGETCLVIGNGLSLRDVCNSFLDSYPTFGSNRIFLKYIPTYYVCCNPLVLEQNRSIINLLSCEKFLPYGYGIESHNFKRTRTRRFSTHPEVEIYEGYTVTFVSLQLAYYMGFSTVLLVGVDHKYDVPDGTEPNEVLQMTDDDMNHFSPEYFRGMSWNAPDLEQSEISYQMAKEVYEQDYRKIINLTPNTALNVFEKGNINDWLGNHPTRKK